MCDPATAAMIGGAALTGAGSLANSAGQSKARRAQSGVAAAELARQRGYRDASGAAFDTTLGKFEKPQQDTGLKDAQAGRADAAKANITLGNAVFPSARAPNVIADAYRRANADAATTAGNYADASGRFAGYGDLTQTNDIALGRGRDDLNKFSNFARGSNAVTPLEYEAASGQGSTLRGLGDILMGAGNIASLYGFTQPATKGVTVPGGSAVLKSAGTIPGLRI